jgi:membrane fusion protein (multidrug efflux system)
VLFEIDPVPFRLAVAQARSLAQAKVTYDNLSPTSGLRPDGRAFAQGMDLKKRDVEQVGW